MDHPSPRRRLLLAALAATIMAAIVAVAELVIRPEPIPVYLFRVHLGLQDRAITDWSGSVDVKEGHVTSLEGWRFENKDAIQDLKGWQCSTHEYIAPDHSYPITPASGDAKAPPMQPWTNGVLLSVRGVNPTVTLTLTQGKVSFSAADIAFGEPRDLLDGQVRIERLPVSSVLRPPDKSEAPGQDDHPALWVSQRTGKQYLAWVAYRQESDHVLLAHRDSPDEPWSLPMEIAERGDHFRVAVAETDGRLWVVWASQREHVWNLFGRSYFAGRLGEEVRLTEGPGPHLWHRMTADRRGRAWLVWQGFHEGQADIFARCADGAGWHEPVRVSSSPANDWDPAIVADVNQDRVWVGWDTYEGGKYGVRVRSLSGGPTPQLGEVLTPEESPRFEAHVSLACDRAGRLWMAWDEAGPQWGKDSGFLYGGSTGTRLYASRRLRVKCWTGGRWLEPAADLDGVLRALGGELNELPRLQEDGAGRLWLMFRHRTCRMPRRDGLAIQGRWDVFATAYLGDRWVAPVELPHSGGRNDMRTDAQISADGAALAAYASDNRSWLTPSMGPQNQSIAVSRLEGAAQPGQVRLVEGPPPQPAGPPVHPREKEQVARIRAYKIEAGAKTYRIYRGDLHRHTDISLDGMGDGSLMDLHRYALDAAALDFVLVADHNMGNDKEYPWWRTQQANDLYTVPGTFLSMYGYERSVLYPNGHRNVIWTERGHRTLPVPTRAFPARMQADTARLYDYLRATNGICTAHSSATDQGTPWEELDGTLEPVVEIFQGFHTSYEAPDAPHAESDKTDRVHGLFRPDGFVSEALARGHRLGFQASSDHVSTHVSYACVLAEELSRTGLVEAIRQRHTYAATDNIVLDVRMGMLGIMGDEVRTTAPRLDVVVLGTGPIERVDVIRDGEVVHTETVRPDVEEARFHWEDPAPKRGAARPSYYYVRVVQRDGQMAWASPIWVHGMD